MENVRKRPIVMLIAGQLGAAALLLGLPTALLLGVFIWPWTSAALLALVLAQVGLHASQLATRGTWVPEKWAAALLVPIPLAYCGVAVGSFAGGSILQGLAAVLMAALAAVVVVRIIKSWWAGRNRIDSPAVTPHRRPPTGAAPDDEPMTMVF